MGVDPWADYGDHQTPSQSRRKKGITHDYICESYVSSQKGKDIENMLEIPQLSLEQMAHNLKIDT